MHKFKRKSRTITLKNIFFACFAVIALQLFILQVLQSSKYKALANKEQLKQYKIPAQRGIIYAMDGKKPIKLVLNETIYSMFADPSIIKDSQKDTIKDIINPIAGGNLVDNYKELLDKKETRYQVVGKKLNRKQVESIKDKLKEKKITGIGFTAQSQRVYPEGSLASQTLGFVNSEGGKYGIEQSMNSELTGKDGMLKATTDIFGKPLAIGKDDVDVAPQNGKNIVLSIDRNIQAETEKILAEHLKKTGMKNASVVIMNPDNGKVMAMANNPTFNPAEYWKVKNGSDFNNDVTIMPYENGSVMKSFTMAMGINEGVIQPSSTFYNTDRKKVEDRIIGNAAEGHTGNITFQTAMDYSLNTGMVTIAERLGGGSIDKKARNTMYDYLYNHFGLGQKTGIEVYESKGDIVPPTAAEGNAVRYSNMSFGQGMNTTMIQTAAGFSAIVNGGKLYEPSVINGEIDKEGKFIKKDSKLKHGNAVSAQTSEEMKSVLYHTRHISRNRDLEGYVVGGKTGTSQTIVDGKYVDNQTIASYLGFGGNDKPKYVMMVAVWGKNQNPQGWRDAQPIFTDISNWLLRYLKIQPKG